MYYKPQVRFRYSILIYVTYKQVCHPVKDKETIKEQQRLNVFGFNNLVEADEHWKYHDVNHKHHKSEVILYHVPVIILPYNKSGFLDNTIGIFLCILLICLLFFFFLFVHLKNYFSTCVRYHFDDKDFSSYNAPVIFCFIYFQLFILFLFQKLS